ncbi:MFS transporter [Streptococcus iners]|uniref:MFS transporter n=1 Tax=Streptococcus iners TaxID=3028084 RepID=A0AA96VHU3_9STRE|nr:MFS transporter [Streptococcus sp. 29887]MCK4025523.1 SLC45 family MFS transporter [Streptococcus suis]WNY50122.1 MFS transporter [Streptococcus sp. 29887]
MKLDYKRTIYIGMAFLGISAFWQLYDVIIPLILENQFALDKTWTGLVMSLDNILSLFLLPFFGAISDRLNCKYGRRLPFVFVGTVLSVIGLLLLPYATNQHSFWLFNLGLGIVLLAMSISRAPAVALMPDLTPKELRSKANAVINLMGAVGAIFALLAIRFLVGKSDQPDYTAVFLAVACILLVSFAILGWKINERTMSVDEISETIAEQASQKLPREVKRSFLFLLTSIFLWFMAYNGITTAFSRYAIAVWDMSAGEVATSLIVATIVAIVSYIPSGFVGTALGRKKAILIGICLVTTTYGLGIVFTSFSPLVYLSFAIMGMGWAFINVNSLPMLVEMSHHSDVGKYTGMYYTASMAAQIVTPILSGFLMQSLGFKILFPYALIFSLLSFGTMTVVRHGDSKLEKERL